MMDDTNPFARQPCRCSLTPSRPKANPNPASTQGPSPGQRRLAASPTLSAAVEKFKSCRWRATPEVGEFCTHRDVLPFAGKEGFDRRLVVPGVRVLQAPPDAEEARTDSAY